MTVNGWTITDTVLNSPFKDAFDALVKLINQKLQELGVVDASGNDLIVKPLNQMGHRDAIQLIPVNP